MFDNEDVGPSWHIQGSESIQEVVHQKICHRHACDLGRIGFSVKEWFASRQHLAVCRLIGFGYVDIRFQVLPVHAGETAFVKRHAEGESC